MRERTVHCAEVHGILPQLNALEQALLEIKGIPDVDFDVDNYDEIPYVIVVPHFVLDPSLPDYFKARKEQLVGILHVLAEHDLHASGDVIEDMGEHWYIVRRVGKTWPRPRSRKEAA